MNVFLEACGLHRTYASVGSLNLIGAQQLNNLVCTMVKGKNVYAWIVQCSTHSKLNVANLEKIKSSNGMYLCSDIGV